MDTTDWANVTRVYNDMFTLGQDVSVSVTNASGDTLTVRVPAEKVKELMERLPLYDAVVT